jgi:hypothetical protein
MSNGEQDKAIMALTAELRVTNNELKHTNENLKKAFECYDKSESEIRDIKEKIIPPIQDKLSNHGVWIKILSTAILAAIGTYVTNLVRGR